MDLCMQDDKIGQKIMWLAPPDMARLPPSIIPTKQICSKQPRLSLNLQCFTREIVRFLAQSPSSCYIDFYGSCSSLYLLRVKKQSEYIGTKGTTSERPQASTLVHTSLGWQKGADFLKFKIINLCSTNAIKKFSDKFLYLNYAHCLFHPKPMYVPTYVTYLSATHT
jgi:hypothetical protein